jgi:thymidylate kinase
MDADNAPDLATISQPPLSELAAEVIDSAVDDRALVFGSLPPAGRDLDILVRPSEERAVQDRLAAAGFIQRGNEWACFTDGSAYGVEVLSAAAFDLPDAEFDALFREAVPLDGFRHLVEPAPHHRLLILAANASAVNASRRARVERALEQDPHAWERARNLAPAWNVTKALARLEEAMLHAPGRRRRRSLRGALSRHQRGRLIALSGIDGAGKSSQAETVKSMLEQLGYEVTIEWKPLGQNAALDRIAHPVKRRLARVRALTPSPDREQCGAARGDEPNPGSVLRQRSALVNAFWLTFVAFTNAATHVRLAVPHLLAGRVVIFDRYVVDSVVRLRFAYGEDRSFSLQKRLIRWLSPAAVYSAFLDTRPETSLARKDDRWEHGDLEAQARLYREEYAGLGATRLDGERPRDELSAVIAAEAWRRLR